MVTTLVPKADINQVKAFHAYCLLGGDTARVAMLFRTDQATIDSLAHDFNWKAEITGLARMDTEAGLTEQQQIHRVGVFITAERAKKIFITLFEKIENDPEFAERMMTKLTNDGALIVFDSKALLDLVKGFQSLSELSYRALGDEPKAGAGEQGSGAAAAAASIALYQAMQERFRSGGKVDATSAVGDALKNVTLSARQ